MPDPKVTVVIPTLVGGATLVDCILSLDRQTQRDFEVIVVDNSGQRLVQNNEAARVPVTVLHNDANVGFGAAINQGISRSKAPFLAVLNDDAVAHAGWLEALVRAMESRDDAGMCASQVRLAGYARLDSAGMLMGGDGTSKQRGHLAPPETFCRAAETLFPSASAALYRRAMLDEIGGFDDSFFLYCEDTDLGLRARWAGWECLYVPQAVVEHRYSHSAGAASSLKAYYVERNRVFVVVKNFPVRLLAGVPLYAIARYAWHLVYAFRGRGAAARFREGGQSALRLIWFVLRAHLAAAPHLPRLLRDRRRIRRAARLSARQFCRLLRAHSISPRQVAAL